MIEQLNQLALVGNVQRMNLSIQPAGNSAVHVVVTCVMHEEQNDPPEEQIELRKKLAKPLVISGYAGEVDVKLADILEKYVNSTSRILPSLKTNLAEYNEGVDKISKTLKKVSEGGVGEGEGEGVSGAGNEAGDSDDSVAEKLASGEAESL